MTRLTVPRDIFLGRGAIGELESLRGSKATIVTGGNPIRRSGILDRAVAHIGKTGMEIDIIDGVDPQFNMRTVIPGARRMIEFEPQWIIALGGGSVIDAAKVMWLLYEYPEIRFNELISPLELVSLRRKAKLAAIPTTSGQGSEVGALAVLADAKTGVRYHVNDHGLVPDMAILDPDVADTMPKPVAINSGMGALCHAIEAFVSPRGFMLSETYALGAVREMLSHLVASCEGDPYAREQVHYAQCMAGIAASNAGMGLTQAFANKLSGGFAQSRIPHGRLSAALLPYVIRYNMSDPQTLTKYANLARTVGLAGESETSLVHALIERINSLLDRFAIPKTLKALGIAPNDFEEKFVAMSKLINEDVAAATNPRKVSEKEVGKLLINAYEGM